MFFQKNDAKFQRLSRLRKPPQTAVLKQKGGKPTFLIIWKIVGLNGGFLYCKFEHSVVDLRLIAVLLRGKIL